MYILKVANSFFSNKLSDIINLSFLTGTFPDLCKLAKIIPLFKNDNPLLCENYRPISLLPVYSKIFEKVIYTRMYKFLDNNNLIHLNIHSIQHDIDEFRTFLDSAKHKFDIIALTETKLQNDPAVNIFLPGYRNLIHTFIEASKGGVCFYVSENIDFKPRNDLKVYESKKIVFIHRNY